MSGDQFAVDFLSTLQKLRDDRLFCDAVLSTDDGCGEIWAHRVVLATASARICATLSSQWKAAEGGVMAEQRIRLPGCDLRAVEVVVSYLYSGKLVMPASFAEPETFNRVLAVCGALEMNVERLNGQSVTFLPDDEPQREAGDTRDGTRPCGTEPDTPDNMQPERQGHKRPYRQGDKQPYKEGDKQPFSCGGSSDVEPSDDDYVPREEGYPDENGSYIVPESCLLSSTVCEEIAVTTSSPTSTKTALDLSNYSAQRDMRSSARERTGNKKSDQAQNSGSPSKARDPSADGLIRECVVRVYKLGEPSCEDARKKIEIAPDPTGGVLNAITKKNDRRGASRRVMKKRVGNEEGYENGIGQMVAVSADATRRPTICVEVENNGEMSEDNAQSAFNHSDDAVKPHKRYRPRARESQKFLCNLCDRRFHRLVFFKRHLAASHPDYQPHICVVCGALFDTSTELDTHVPSHVRLSGTSNRPTRYQRRALEREKYQCAVCLRRFLRLTFFKRHILSDHPGYMPHICDLCGSVFETRAALDEHVPLHAEGFPYLCDICGKGFNIRRYLRLHALRHEGGPRPYLCDTCGKGFYEQVTLDRHMLTWHTAVRPHMCSVCSKGYVSRAQLEEHERMHTSERRHVCDMCHATFASVSGLRHHRLRHGGIKPYVCPTCQCNFTQKSTLQNHMRLHSDEPRRTFECEVCGKGLSTRANLSAHQRTHFPPDSSLACAMCARTFKNRTCLLRHITIHADLTHPCPDCGKKFRGAFRLAIHRKLHLALQCRMCDKALTGTRALQCHMMRYHAHSDHVCDVCGKSFESSRLLYFHSRLHDAAYAGLATINANAERAPLIGQRQRNDLILAEQRGAAGTRLGPRLGAAGTRAGRKSKC